MRTVAMASNVQHLNFGLITLPNHLTKVSVTCEYHGPYLALRCLTTGTIIGNCPKCEESIELSNIRAGQVNHFHKISGVPPIFEDKNIYDYEAVEESQIKAKERALSFVSGHLANPSRCLIMVGDTGTGKTHLAIGIIKELIEKGLYCRYTTLGNMFSSVKSTYNNGSLLTEDEVANNLIRPAVLVIDEVGMKTNSKWEDDFLYRIVNGRYETGRSTIIVSNLQIDDLKLAIGQRLTDRMREDGGRLITMKHGSHRR